MKKERYEFLVLTSVIFSVGFILYGIVGIALISSNTAIFDFENPYLGFIVLASFGGYFFFSLLTGVLFTTKWISKKSLKKKIIFTVFFFVPIWLAMFAIVYSIPYWVYNLIQYRKAEI